MPTIPFADSSFRSVTNIELQDESDRLMYSEILACGRIGSRERFAYRFYGNRMRIGVNGRLIYADNTVFEPSTMAMDAYCLYEGYHYYLNVVLVNWNLEEDVKQRFYQLLEETELHCKGGLSKTGYGAYCIRILGKRSETLMEIENRIKLILFDILI